MQYSGRIVVRLAAHLDLPKADGDSDLYGAADTLDADGLARVLEQNKVLPGMTGRLVDIQVEGCNGQEEPRTTYEREAAAAGTSLPPRHPLSSYWRIDARKLHVETEAADGESWRNGWRPSYRQTVRRLVRELNELPSVDLAYRELAATDPQHDVYRGVQEHLDRAPIGIGARWLWRYTPDDAEDVGFMDLEQGWRAHEDLAVDPAAALVVGDNRHGSGTYRGHHGTAVLSEVVGRHGNDLGVAGISKRARVVRLASHWDAATEAYGNVANAVRHAIEWLDAGDVLLLEVQRSYLPTEADHADRDAIRLAGAHGIVVVEAAGNGNANLDRYVDEEGRRALSRRHPDFQESGAILVAAARAARPHDRLAGRVGVGSNHGSRVDCFAHGERVAAAGYGDMNSYLEAPGVAPETAEQRAYSARFGGTSGAAPIVAGAALVVQGVRERAGQPRFSPWEMRRLLADPRYGTRQGHGVRGRIGVMPDLRRLLRDRLGLVSDVHIRSSALDEGAVPVVGRTDRSPDIRLQQAADAAPAADIVNDDGLPALAAAGDFSVYVRLHNRGRQPADAADVRLFWSPVATLVTPDLWNPIEGGAAAVGEEPVWAGPFALGAPAEERCCLVATVEDRRDEEGESGLATPPDRWPYFDWRRYLAFLRWRNNIACCNVHRVDAGREAELAFRVTGTPERARTFSLELVRRLPGGVTLELDAQAALASQIASRRLWRADSAPGGPEQIRLTPPSQPRVLIEPLRLVAGASFPCTLRVGGGSRPGDSLAIRQLYRGREVGRITWRFGGAE